MEMNVNIVQIMKIEMKQILLNLLKDIPDDTILAKKIAEKTAKYRVYQYLKDRVTLVKVWDRIFDVIVENPTYKKHNIYAVCSGEKPSIYGYWWRKELIE